MNNSDSMTAMRTQNAGVTPEHNRSILIRNSTFHIAFMPDSGNINRQIIEGYQHLTEKDFMRRSHFFHGRYENLYLQRARIQAIDSVLDQAERYAAKVLDLPRQTLRSGFWINDMGPNAVTSEHDHDDYDELLSGVYYANVPQNSGELHIVDRHSVTIVRPEAGMFVFFAPSVRHSVSINLSGEQRISIGMNFGPVPVQEPAI